jgi:septum formation topological specificity factor MinE
MLERMKDELITVISRYVEIDEGQVQVALTQGKRESRLVADIPVLGPAVAARSAAVRSGAGGDG